jgi:transcription elongation factor GreA
MMTRFPITVLGKALLEQELNELKTIKRPHVIAAIGEARAHGDLRENAEYHAAKEQQSFIEGRILEIENKLAQAEIVDPKALNHQGRVVFGATISICNVETEEEFKYQIVGEDEADLKQGKISYKSPIARSIIGKERGDVISVTTPGGLIEYEVTEIEYV